jgi:hypothetical protein
MFAHPDRISRPSDSNLTPPSTWFVPTSHLLEGLIGNRHSILNSCVRFDAHARRHRVRLKSEGIPTRFLDVDNFEEMRNQIVEGKLAREALPASKTLANRGPLLDLMGLRAFRLEVYTGYHTLLQERIIYVVVAGQACYLAAFGCPVKWFTRCLTKSTTLTVQYRLPVQPPRLTIQFVFGHCKRSPRRALSAAPF